LHSTMARVRGAGGVNTHTRSSAQQQQHPNAATARAARAAAPQPPPHIESPEERLNRKLASIRSNDGNNNSGRTVGSGSPSIQSSGAPSRRLHVETPEERLSRKLLQGRQQPPPQRGDAGADFGNANSAGSSARVEASGSDENRNRSAPAAGTHRQRSAQNVNSKRTLQTDPSKQQHSMKQREKQGQRQQQWRDQAVTQKLLQGGEPVGTSSRGHNVHDGASQMPRVTRNQNSNRGGSGNSNSNTTGTDETNNTRPPSGRSLTSGNSMKGSTMLIMDPSIQVGAIAVAGPDAEDYNGYRTSRYNDDELVSVYNREGRAAAARGDGGRSGSDSRNNGAPGGPGVTDEESSIHNENMHEDRPEKEVVKPKRKCIIIAAAVILVVAIGAALGGAAASGAFSNNDDPAPDVPSSTSSLDSSDPPISTEDASPMDNIPLQCRPQKLPYEATLLKERSFGASVAISGNNAFVGASMDSVGRGAVYSFYKSGSDGTDSASSSSWSSDFGTIVPGGGALIQGNEFGRSLAADGDILAVGALCMPDNENPVGCVYIYTRSSLGWSQKARIVPDENDLTDRSFGSSIAIDYIGDERQGKKLTLIVGEPLGRHPEGLKGGAAYVFTQSEGGEWSQNAKLLPFDRSEDDQFDSFGYRVALHGTFVVVSSYKDDTDVGRDSGSVYVYSQGSTGGSWSFMTKIVPEDGGASFDTFGRSVSIYDDIIAIGADGDDDDGLSSGSVYIFRLDGNAWVQEAKLGPNDGEASKKFGASVALGEGGILVVGATGDSSGMGAIYTFQRRGNGWEQQDKIVASGPSSVEKFGSGLALDGKSVIVGAFDGGDRGNKRGDAFTLALC